MSADDYPLINDPHAPHPHAPTRHPEAETVNGADYYASFADSDQDKPGSGVSTTPSSKRNQPQYYGNNKKHKPNGGEPESNVNSEYRSGGGGDHRKDREEWSDTAIACLLETYTEKYNQLNRGNLRGRDWEEVAEAVSEKGGTNSKKSVEQCKNKIDNLKKRYKVELQRINNNPNTSSGGLGASSSWHWYKQIEVIMGNSSNVRSGGGGVTGDSEGSGGNAPGNGNLVVRQTKR